MDYKIQKTIPMEDIRVLQRVAEMEAERYSKKGDYSVTDLISPVRVVHLNRRWRDKAPMNVENMTNSMLGTAVHEYFEKYLDMWIDKHDYKHYELEKQTVQEWPCHLENGEPATRLISGRFDIREDKDLFDLKVIKVWKLVFDPNLDEYHEQQNMYSHLLHLEGIDLETLNIVAFYKDWQEGTALRDWQYPRSQLMQYQLTKWSNEETSALISRRLQALVDNEPVADNLLPICSRDERWERHQGGETIHYAVLKNAKAKRATKVIKGGSLEDAMKIAHTVKGLGKGSLLEVRYALPKRCVGFCDINPWCSWYQNWKKKNDEGKVNEYIPIY